MKTTSSFFTKFRQFCKRSCISVIDDNMRKWCWYQRNENALKIIHTKTQIVRTLILDRLTRWTGVTLNVRLFYSVFEKVLILLYVERKHKKKDKDRVSLISELWYGFPPVLLLTFNFFFLFFLIIFFFWYILLFYQPTSVKVVDEIKFKTIIPACSLVIRDHCWLTDGMSLFSSFPISFSQFIYLFCLNICCQYTMSMKFHGCCCLLLSYAEIPRGSSGIPSLYKTPKSVRLSGRLPVIVSYMENILFVVCLFIFFGWKHGFL